MKIHPCNRRRCHWYPYTNGEMGWIHFQYLDGHIDRLAGVPKEFVNEIKKRFMKDETILYTEWNKHFQNPEYYARQHRYEYYIDIPLY